jgi:hypothetical protein
VQVGDENKLGRRNTIIRDADSRPKELKIVVELIGSVEYPILAFGIFKVDESLPPKP